MASIEERLMEVMRDVFDRPELAYSPGLSAAEVEEWDSLSHINFLVSLEKEFKLRFSLAEVKPLKNVGEMSALIARKLPAAG